MAIQLVASLAFPGIARAYAAPPAAGTHTARRDALRQAFVLAWVLACAAAAALAGLAPSLAQLLFGWGRMPPEAVAQIADWARVGAWSLLPQALLAVLLEAVPVMRRDADFDRLAEAAVKFSSARTHVEWTFATAAAGRAILPILRRDMLHAMPHLPERK